MYQKVARLKLRFDSVRGNVMAEDLWDLSLVELDSLAKDLNNKLKASNQESFIVEVSKPDEILQLKFDVVLDVIKTLMAEAKINQDAIVKQQKKNQLFKLIADKENDELAGKSIEELRQMVQEL